MVGIRVCVGAGLVLSLACGGKSHNSNGAGGSANGGASSVGGSSGSAAIGNAGGAPAGSGGGGTPSNGGSTSGGSASGGRPGQIVKGPLVPSSQLDFLLMIDNSLSMSDKQAVLAGSLPAMLQRLTSPNCVDAGGAPTGVKVDANGACSAGMPEFAPVRDLHIAVITSSLGAHGGQICTDPIQNDRAQLLPLVRPEANYPVKTWNDSGFLSWDPAAKSMPPGESDLAALTLNFKNLVLSAGQNGCGFEAQLESWYRFLIDPDPPISVPTVTDQGLTKPTFVDAAQNPILQQRAQFLRPDSAVLVLMLTDENDCSIKDYSQAWLTGTQTLNGQAFRMPRATSVCETNPNSPCCMSCFAVASVAGCPNPSSDPSCADGGYHQPIDDALNLRCYEQKRRFGYDMLHPIERYIDGLTRSHVQTSHLDGVNLNEYGPNPLFPPGSKRTSSMVFLAGIVGVPWQDLATKESAMPGTPLDYLPFQELVAQGRWPMVLGDAGDEKTPPTPPLDKLMVETHLDRTTLFPAAPHPLLGAAGALAPASSSAIVNVINGHESNITRADDLQYACIFPLPTPRPRCDGLAGCECQADSTAYNRALCDGFIQQYAKAYPSVRELRVLKGVGDISGNAIATSICAKEVQDTTSAGYGYVPAMSAIVNALKPALK